MYGRVRELYDRSKFLKGSKLKAEAEALYHLARKRIMLKMKGVIATGSNFVGKIKDIGNGMLVADLAEVRSQPNGVFSISISPSQSPRHAFHYSTPISNISQLNDGEILKDERGGYSDIFYPDDVTPRVPPAKQGRDYYMSAISLDGSLFIGVFDEGSFSQADFGGTSNVVLRFLSSEHGFILEGHQLTETTIVSADSLNYSCSYTTVTVENFFMGSGCVIPQTGTRVSLFGKGAYLHTGSVVCALINNAIYVVGGDIGIVTSIIQSHTGSASGLIDKFNDAGMKSFIAFPVSPETDRHKSPNVCDAVREYLFENGESIPLDVVDGIYSGFDDHLLRHRQWRNLLSDDFQSFEEGSELQLNAAIQIMNSSPYSRCFGIGSRWIDGRIEKTKTENESEIVHTRDLFAINKDGEEVLVATGRCTTTVMYGHNLVEFENFVSMRPFSFYEYPYGATFNSSESPEIIMLESPQELSIGFLGGIQVVNGSYSTLRQLREDDDARAIASLAFGGTIQFPEFERLVFSDIDLSELQADELTFDEDADENGEIDAYEKSLTSTRQWLGKGCSNGELFTIFPLEYVADVSSNVDSLNTVSSVLLSISPPGSQIKFMLGGVLACQSTLAFSPSGSKIVYILFRIVTETKFQILFVSDSASYNSESEYHNMLAGKMMDIVSRNSAIYPTMIIKWEGGDIPPPSEGVGDIVECGMFPQAYDIARLTSIRIYGGYKFKYMENGKFKFIKYLPITNEDGTQIEYEEFPFESTSLLGGANAIVVANGTVYDDVLNGNPPYKKDENADGWLVESSIPSRARQKVTIEGQYEADMADGKITLNGLYDWCSRHTTLANQSQ